MLDTNKIKKDFPLFENNPNIVYLDNGATSLKPKCVIDKMNEYYYNYGVNIHRGVYKLSYQATDEFDIAREKVAKFINSKVEEVVFVRNASEALNLAALTYGEKNLNEGDVVITSELEHHSSVLPWMKMCEKKKANLVYVPLNEEGRITVEAFKSVINEKTKVVALTYVSNVMGYVTPIKEIIDIAHSYGAIVIVDAAQAVPHMKVDVKELDCDFLAFSGHKMMGPTGVGVLFGKKAILKKLDPLYYGGDMNDEVYKDSVDVKDIPSRFETGTPAIASVIGMIAAIDYIESIGYDKIHKHTQALHEYTISKLKDIEGVTIYNINADVPIISFNITGVHPHDASTLFDEAGICLRAGHHCAQLITKWLNCIGTLRGSFYIYNTKEDADKFIEKVKEAVEFFKRMWW